MSISGGIDTVAVDSDVVYATGDDVFAHLRNKRYVDLSDEVDKTRTPADAETKETSVTKGQVVDLIARMTEQVDTHTKRAWRRRRVEQYDARVRFPHHIKRGRHRRRSRRASVGSTRRINVSSGLRGTADLPHVDVVAPDSTQGDTVEVLNPRETRDITGQDDREDGLYVVDERKGIIKPQATLYVPTSTSAGRGRDIDDARLRVSYRYGKDASPDAAAVFGDRKLSTVVPGDIRDATALLVVSRLLMSDQYGELVPNGSGDSPNLSQAADSYKQDAYDVLDRYARV